MIKQPFWNNEKLLGISALLVSTMSLIVFVYQTDLLRKQQYMSVYPHLLIINSGSGSLNYKFQLMNQGIGPAFIKDIYVADLAGNTYESLTGYLETQLSVEDSIWIYTSDLFVGRLIPANEIIELYGLQDEATTNKFGLPGNTIEGANKLRNILNNDSLIYKITYESIYGESWTIKSGETIPVKNSN